MKELNLKQLKAFTVLARVKHFGRAAELCTITQPALTLQLQALEKQLGGKLVARSQSPLSLTPLGQQVLPKAIAILKAVDELAESSQASQTALQGPLRLGIIPTIAPYLLPRALKRLKTSHPTLKLQCREATTTKLVNELKEGRIDVAVVALPIGDAQLAEYSLFEEPFLLVRPLAQQHLPLPKLNQLHSAQLLLLEEGHCLRAQALAVCGAIQGQHTRMLDASSLTTLIHLVEAELGLTLLPAMAAGEAKHKKVQLNPFAEPQPTRTIGLIWRKESPFAVHYIKIGKAFEQTP